MSKLAQTLVSAVGQHLRGKEDAIEAAVVALFAGGHILLEDQPGVGKTLLARTLARALDLPFQRVQCTADLLPSDIVGAQIFHPRSGELSFRPGPVFTSVLLADELNRTPPRTQSALLECMAERRVTIDRQTHALPDPFFVIATQNPLTAAGTYPLPENQLDRFLLRIELGYPDFEHEIEAVAREDGHRLVDDLKPVASRDELLAARAAVDAVRCDRELSTFMVELAHRTRNAGDGITGVSTRGAQALHRACRARAHLHGRDFVVPDDVRALLVPAWAHRLGARSHDEAEATLHEILAETPLPD
ncbi:MAG: AAA family ATPase [Planctomycetes bacterium]|nr:AAA family ATPase [Planctomycetota bacterium]MCB9884702.1 AAA family ATPase [Planctomycetota bacterium]